MAQDLSSQPSDTIWQSHLRDFLHDCAASSPQEQADRIREAGVLLRQKQALAATGMRHFPRTSEIHAMIDGGAFESAVLALMGPEASVDM